jgi:glycosyltransferase involved in cell wall biosynthesis
MTTRKRPLLAIEAAERAGILRRGISLVMLGDGPLLEEARRRARSVQAAVIEFRGNVSNVLEEMANSDIFIQTSADEGISYAVLEAMSLGLPVVATDVGATSEAVLGGDTGYVVGAKGTAAEMARRVAFLSEHQDVARTMGNSGLKRCQTVFSMERMLEETLKFYGEKAVPAQAGR